MRGDQWREVAAVPANNFRGLTELRRGDRAVACCGTGESVRMAIIRQMDAPRPSPPQQDETEQ